jgi:hypothetical protein
MRSTALAIFSLLNFLLELVVRAMRKVPTRHSLDFFAKWLPRRVAEEDLGDFLEELPDRQDVKDWRLYLWIAKRITQLVFNGLRESTAQLMNRIAGRNERRD